ncbi:hypothetical protein BDZ88DRAFT_378941, partial [Geranomyces variabilis]
VNKCANCGTDSTPLWRRGPKGEVICNACGLYLKARNTYRPQYLKKRRFKREAEAAAAHAATATATATAGGIIAVRPGNANSTGHNNLLREHMQCINCSTTSTPLWRRDDKGNPICNACGLYFKLHSSHRPVTMKRAVIKR